MRTFAVLFLTAILFTAGARAGTPRFVIDDEEYVEKVTEASAKLLQAGKLKSLDMLRGEVRNEGFALKPAPLSHQKLSAPGLCDHLRQSTLAVGSYYKVSISALPRLGAQPEFVPMIVSTRLIQRTEVGKALMSPRLTWPLEATLVLPTA